MATAMGYVGAASWISLTKKKMKGDKIRFNVSCIYSPSVSNPYKTLRIQPDASETDVRKAFRQLALQTVMSNLRGETKSAEIFEEFADDDYDSMRGVNDPDWDMWEEWMGWEGAGIRDYSSHINPYI
ncbi:chaperone protein dnaJ 8, chloroplastic-like isoform X2 [Lycium ferocissimum]|uniref:chaperone protein dnaJ 8, chloroplastic-like isoform X2 n=1 Tax=Lycium ferocissimum TaxID=112874 RepID=UPI0028153E57|nr:chaperone protein dnaJ 8, chloroplastic-like isoform X2 [Lycium ferocissimum]